VLLIVLKTEMPGMQTMLGVVWRLLLLPLLLPLPAPRPLMLLHLILKMLPLRMRWALQNQRQHPCYLKSHSPLRHRQCARTTEELMPT
jgi:hypothetical protein